MPEFDPIAYRVYSDWAKRGDRSSKAVYRAINEAARATKAWLDSPPAVSPRPYPSIWDRLSAHVEADPTPAGEWRLTEGEHRLIGAVQHAQSEPRRRFPRTSELSDDEISDIEEAAAAHLAEVDPDDVDRRDDV